MIATLFRVFFISIAFGATLMSVSAAEVWTRMETPNFEVIGNATDAEIRAVAEKLERFRKAVSSMITVRQSAAKTRVIVFKDDASFRPFKPKRADGSPDDLVAGLFQPGEDVNYIVVAGGGADLSTIYHEFAHDILNANYGSTAIPAWLNEGLAEYFQTFLTVDASTTEIGKAPPSHLSMLRRGPLIPWDEFFAVDNYSLQQRGAHSRTMFYAQAWAVVRYMIETIPPGELLDPKVLQEHVRRIDRNRLTTEVGNIVRSGANPKPLRGDATDLTGVDPSSLSEARANAYLGDLLYHTKDYAGAETYLRRALSQDAGMPAANASLGMVRLKQRRFAEAKRLLETAIAVDAENHLVHFHYAYLLTRQFMDAAGLVTHIPPATAKQIRTSLRRALLLNDQFAESYRLLAFTALVTNEELGEALAGLKKAEILRPGDAEIALMVPQILLRQENADEAWKSASAIYNASTDPRTKKEALGLMEAANQLTAARSPKGQIVLAGSRQPIIYQRKDLTDEQVASLEKDRVINNVNILIERPQHGEQQAVGTLGKITCSDGAIGYSFRTDTGGSLRLSGRRFDDLRLKVLIEGTRSFAFRCDNKVTDELTVITYRPPARPVPGNDGELLSITFVPPFFKLKPLEEAALAPQVIIQGGPATPLEENERISAAERAEMQRAMLETQIRDLEERLRPVEVGEKRSLGTPERLDCINGRMVLSAKTPNGLETFSAAISDGFAAASFNSDAGIIEIGCLVQLPSLPAVITYREKPSGRDLIAVEFVPTFFTLNKY